MAILMLTSLQTVMENLTHYLFHPRTHVQITCVETMALNGCRFLHLLKGIGLYLLRGGINLLHLEYSGESVFYTFYYYCAAKNLKIAA